MKKFYKIFLLLTALIFLTTYDPSEINFFSHKSASFFNIKKIKILNSQAISEKEIDAKLTNIYGRNIFLINKNDLVKPLESIFFLEKIEVKKKYPNTLIIKVHETKPIAILFKKNEKYILDNLSNLIPINGNFDDKDLPVVFGEGAEKDFVNFFNQLKSVNFPIERIKNYFFFQIGRWDLKLSNEQIIKLPINKTNEAIQESIKLLNLQDFKNYRVIDLRIHDKIVVE